MVVPAFTDVSHFRAPYKNAVFSGFGATEAELLASISTVGPDGVRVLAPAAAAILASRFAQAGVMQVLADPPAAVVQGPTAAQRAGTIATTYGHPSAMAWIQAEYDRGNSVALMTTTPGGLPTLLADADGATFWNVANNADNFSPGMGQLSLTSVPYTDELKVASAASGNALFMPSKVKPGALPGPGGVLAPSRAGLGGPVAVALVALVVVGGVWYAFGRKKHRRYDD